MPTSYGRSVSRDVRLRVLDVDLDADGGHVVRRKSVVRSVIPVLPVDTYRSEGGRSERANQRRNRGDSRGCAVARRMHE